MYSKLITLIVGVVDIRRTTSIKSALSPTLPRDSAIFTFTRKHSTLGIFYEKTLNFLRWKKKGWTPIGIHPPTNYNVLRNAFASFIVVNV